MIRFVAPLALAGLLAACSNSGDSFLEWDQETAAVVAAQEAAAEAAAKGETAPDTIALEVPVMVMFDDGSIAQGVLARPANSTQLRVILSDGTACTGGVVPQAGAVEGAPAAGAVALNCANGAVWLGDYVEEAPDHGVWTLRNASGLPGRGLYGSDVPLEPIDADAFEAIWQARPAAPAAG